MFVDFIKSSGLLSLPILAMAFFIALFTGMLVWTLSRKKSHYDPTANLPLRED